MLYLLIVPSVDAPSQRLPRAQLAADSAYQPLVHGVLVQPHYLPQLARGRGQNILSLQLLGLRQDPDALLNTRVAYELHLAVVRDLAVASQYARQIRVVATMRAQGKGPSMSPV